MFQTMMNKILWNLINTGKVASFIDDVIVGTEKEEDYMSSKGSSKEVSRENFICKTRKMQVKD